jgi:adenylosuccinate lyase
MGAFPVVLGSEVDRYLPLLSTTEILTELVKTGVDREKGHEQIKKYAVATALGMRTGKQNTFIQDLADDPVIKAAGLDQERVTSLIERCRTYVGNAREQVDAVCVKAKPLLTTYAQQARYEPRPIL